VQSKTDNFIFSCFFFIFWLYVCLICSGTLLSVFHSVTVSLLRIPHILMMDSLPHLGNILCWEIWYSCSSKMYKRSHVASFLHQIFSIKQWKKKADFTITIPINSRFIFWRPRTTWATLEQPSFSKKPQSMHYCWSVWCWLPLVFQLKVTDSWHVGRHLGSIYSTGPITHSKHWKQGWRSSQSLQ